MISQTAKINSITVFEWVEFLRLIHLDRLINYSCSFRKQPAASFFKIKNCCFPDQGNAGYYTNKNYLKRTWPILQFLRPILCEFFDAAKASLVFIKNRCRNSRWVMFFKIGVLKDFAIFTGIHLCRSLFLMKLQAFRCFPVNTAKFLRAAFSVEHLRWVLLQIFCFTLYFQKDFHT